MSATPTSGRIVRSHLAGDDPVIDIRTNVGAGPAIVVDGVDLAVPQTLADLFPDAPVEVDPASETLDADLFDALALLGLVVAPEEEE